MQEYIVAEILKVSGHPSRIKILEALEKGHRCVKDKGILECERRGMEKYAKFFRTK